MHHDYKFIFALIVHFYKFMHLLSVLGSSLNSCSMMTRRLPCSEEKKQIALNVLEICKEEKRYGELFVFENKIIKIENK